MQTVYASGHLQPIVVFVVHKDPLVRAGVVATLNQQSRFAVQVVWEASVEHADAGLVHALREVDVVIADYDRALAIAMTLKKGALGRQALAIKIMIVSECEGESQVRRALEIGIQGYLPIGCQSEEIADGVVALHNGQRLLGQLAAQRVAESFDHEVLTSRQIEVLRLVVAGYANKMVAKELDIALGTVKVHVKSIMGKLGARTRTEAAEVARRRGLIQHESQFSARFESSPVRRSGSGVTTN